MKSTAYKLEYEGTAKGPDPTSSFLRLPPPPSPALVAVAVAVPEVDDGAG